MEEGAGLMVLRRLALMDYGQTCATRIGTQLIAKCSADSYLEEIMLVGVYIYLLLIVRTK